MKTNKTFKINDLGKKVKTYNPIDKILNPENIGLAIIECIETNDPEGLMEILEIVVDALNQSNANVLSSVMRGIKDIQEGKESFIFRDLITRKYPRDQF